ncbi:rod shape-determining protein MreD [Enterobacteriaceae endosymbiont of Donacia tomentosa]|uniref:rod shape-determining protein MreD n=1 Tax=Enterobacteriaceae endosymbiont of Donacia tomentosa TaxID=2675787 RepID=UPI00144A2AC1|nr:rod shape-determining protein MreD [Enterobacteriaceae endosymbiont of Donacia tomentosa]
MRNYLLKLFIYITFFISLILEILFIKCHNFMFHISWTLLIIICWIFIIPAEINIITSFIFGFIIDLFTDSLLGVRSLLFSIVILFILNKHKFIINLNIINKTILIFTTFSVINIIYYYLNGYFLQIKCLNFILQNLINSVLYCVIYFCMKKIKYKYINYF